MPITNVAALWVPAIWTEAVREKQNTFPVIFNSNAVLKSPLLDEIATGGGVSANIPFFKDITDQDDEVQVEDTAPSTQGIGSGVQVAPILNRVTKSGVTALSSAVTGEDVVGEITDQLAERRAKQRQKQLLAHVRGAFGTSPGAALAGAAALQGVRRSVASETGASPPATAIMSSELWIDTVSLMGELQNDLINGAFFCHSQVKAGLQKADAASFKTGIESGLPFNITTYRGVPLFVCDMLVRNGTTSGLVFDSYLMSRGVVGYGTKPQLPDTGETIDVAALQLHGDKDKNNAFIFDRTRFLFHINGLKWIGTPAGQSATNAELGTAANWQLVYSSANRVGIVCMVTNG
jgi:hypothetical protein